MKLSTKSVLLAGGAALIAIAAPARAQQTPGDQSGTPQAAGSGQSAATSTNAPADPGGRAPRAAQTDSGGAGDIIVTARRVEERLQDVPISITVYNQQQLNNRNIVQGTDLAISTPSLSAGTNFGSQNATFSIRGFYQDIGTQPSVGVYFADVVAPRGASNNLPIGDGAGPGDFFDLQNVQVLKGPQGTLFGRNTTGGAILLVPQKPTSRFEGYVEGSYGNYDMKRIQAVVNIPLGDRARFRLGIDHEDRDGYVHNDSGIGPSRYNDIGYTAVRGSMVLDLTPDLENYTIISYLRSDTTGDVQKVVGALPLSSYQNLITRGSALLATLADAQLAREQGTGFFTAQSTLANPRTLLDQWRIINTTTWRASDTITIKNIASYAQLRESYLNPIFGTDFDAHDFAALPNPQGTYISFALSSPLGGRNTAAQDTFTDEIQLQGTGFDNKLNYQMGGYAELTDPLGIAGSESPVLTNCSDPAHLICNNPIGAGDINYTAARTNTRNYGLYAQATYSLTDKLKLTGGVRYTWDRVRDTNYLRSYQFPFGTTQALSTGYRCNDPSLGTDLHPISDANGCVNRLSEKASKPTWLIDVDYKPNDAILTYAKWARGFRAGGLVPQAPVGLQTYSPEKVDDYEVGVKTTFGGPIRGTFNVDGFYNNFTNQQLLSSLQPLIDGLGPASGIINAGKSRIYGVEVDSSISPIRGFTLDVDYTYLHARLRSVNNVTVNNGAFLVTFPAQVGEPLPLSPNHKLSLTGTYTLPLDDSIGKISFGATGIYSSRQLNNYLDEQANYLAPINTLPAGTPGIPAGASLADRIAITRTFAGLTGGTIVPCGQSLEVGLCEQIPVPQNIRKLSYQPSRWIVNLNLNWNGVFGTPFDLQLFATNVLNKKYFAFAAGLFQSTQFETAQYGEPRMFGARLRYHFGR